MGLRGDNTTLNLQAVHRTPLSHRRRNTAARASRHKLCRDYGSVQQLTQQLNVKVWKINFAKKGKQELKKKRIIINPHSLSNDAL